MKIFPVILSGGAGTRLWPLSRKYYPKPLLALISDQSLLQDTVSRLDQLAAELADPIIVCNEEHRFLVAAQVSIGGKSAGAIILEPEGRNTAPALTLAALHLSKENPDAVMLVMPADHVVSNRPAFQQAVSTGVELAQSGYLVTFGIVPDHAETGYGYIKKGESLQIDGTHTVARFVEKPDRKAAMTYLNSGRYLWNSGIFMMRAQLWLEELGRFRPDIAGVCQSSYEGGARDADFYRVDAKVFHACPSDSIDYAVMEKTKRAAVIPLEMGWSDVGTWSSLWEICPRDEQGNVIRGDVFAVDTHNTLLFAEHRCLAAVGVKDLMVIETADAILVVNKDHTQDVKKIVEQLKSANREEYKTHRRVYRPWGSYEGIDAGDRFQVKRLSVKPGASLSLQMHHHRAEHWVVVKGTAKVTRGEDVFTLSENESTYIPVGTKHRLENPGTVMLEIIEVQSGSYLGEDDIVRFEDMYNRHVEK
ncbi:MAG: mannose-1-phosphate guanylyltransferase/mannose-6-phosphate isomerase [Gammaproteobacteria bacterium]